MDTLKDLVARCREWDGTVISVPGRSAPYTYSDFVPNVWKSGNLLGHYGVHPGAEVTVLPGPKHPDGSPTGSEAGRIDTADPIYAILGATLLGACVRLTPETPVTSRVLAGPADWLDEYEIEPSCSLVGYGGPPTDPSMVHFEKEMWCENPTEPPEPVEPADFALQTADECYTHEDVLAVATDIQSTYGLEANDRVVLDASLSEPGAFVAGVLSVLLAGATTVIAPANTESVADDAALLVTDEAGVGRKDVDTVDAVAVTEQLRDTRRV